jgi:ATP-dependent protease ClpP protease subunit
MSANVLNFSGEKWWSVRMAGERAAEIHLRGVIGLSKVYNDYGADSAGTAREFEEELRGLGEVDRITLYVASLGGYVWDALMIHDVIARHPAHVTAVVDGIAASAASFVILAADEISMPANAYVMIHNAMGGVAGDHRAMLDMAERLERWTNDIAKMYARKVGDVSAESLSRFRALMDAETWLSGEEAHEMKLVDVITGAVELAACAVELPGVVMERAPEAVRAALEKGRVVDTATPEMQTESSTTEEVTAEVTAETEAAAVVAEVTETAEVIETPAAETPEVTAAAAPDLASIVAQAVSGAVTPLLERLDQLENRAGIVAAKVTGWGNGQAAENVATGAAAENVIDFASASPHALVALGRDRVQKAFKSGRN